MVDQVDAETPAVETETAAEEQPAPVTVEDFARERGWRPKEEYAGNVDDWRDAKSFLAWGLDRGRDMAKDLKQLRDTTDRMSRTTTTIVEQQVERARQEERARWEQVHAEAVENKDHDTAREAVGEIAKLAAAPKASPQADPTVQSFVAENAWFSADPAAQAVAVATADAAARRGLSTADQLKEAREAVHKRFPEYAPQQAKPPASVAAPASRQAPTGSRKKGFADLPADAQAVARQLLAKGYESSLDAYAEQFHTSKAA